MKLSLLSLLRPLTLASTAGRAAGAAAPAATIDLIARQMAFSMSTISVAAGARVTIRFSNRDPGVPHNFALYERGSAQGEASGPIFVGQVVTGVADINYTFVAPARPGSYFFRCDIHPRQMTGTFVVTAA